MEECDSPCLGILSQGDETSSSDSFEVNRSFVPWRHKGQAPQLSHGFYTCCEWGKLESLRNRIYPCFVPWQIRRIWNKICYYGKGLLQMSPRPSLALSNMSKTWSTPIFYGITFCLGGWFFTLGLYWCKYLCARNYTGIKVAYTEIADSLSHMGMTILI